MIRWEERSGFWARAMAGATDLLAALVLLLIVSVTMTVAGETLAPRTQKAIGGGALCVLWLLYSSTEFIFAGTPGRLLLGQRIARQNGFRPDKWMLFLRWSTKQAPVIVALIDLFLPSAAFSILQGLLQGLLAVGLLAILNDDRLSWHDQWAGTAVWRTRRRLQPPPLPGVPPPMSAMSR
ncbi:MAG: hypothetical protein JWP03_2461 [Phycisphaerales bacterium]|nr:hypothetical protein [Phycisphaerales bacterium]